MTKIVLELRYILLHNRIADLAELAIARGEILVCDRIKGTNEYQVTLPGNLTSTVYKAVSLGSWLYLLNSKAQAEVPETEV